MCDDCKKKRIDFFGDEEQNDKTNILIYCYHVYEKIKKSTKRKLKI